MSAFAAFLSRNKGSQTLRKTLIRWVTTMAFCFMQIPDFRTNFNGKAAPKPWIFEIRCAKLAVSIKVTATWLGTLHPHQRLSRHPLRKYKK
jgi:hypothetical protein